MKKFLALNAALAALLVVSSIVQAQEATAIPTEDGAPSVADVQASPSDQIAPPTPDAVQAVPSVQTVPGITSDCVGCSQATPYFGQGYAAPYAAPYAASYSTPCASGCCNGCGTVSQVAYQAPVVQAASCGTCNSCNGCGAVAQVAYQAPVVQAAGCGTCNSCNGCGTIAQVAYQQPVVQSAPVTTGIITPATAPVVSQNLQTAAPVYSYAPTTSGCSGCGTPAATYAPVANYTPAPTYTQSSGCSGCGTTTAYTPTTYAPVSGCSDCGYESYSSGRVRTRLGGRLLRRN